MPSSSSPLSILCALWLGLVASACADARDFGRQSPPPAGNAETGELRVRLGGPHPEFRFPRAIAYPGGSLSVPDGEMHRFEVPGGASELIRIEIAEWIPIWLLIPPGETGVLHSDPCCGVAFAGSAHAAEEAICPTRASGEHCARGAEAGDGDCHCPEGTVELRPGLANDEICGDAGRCVTLPQLRVVRAQGARNGVSLQHVTGRRFAAAATLADASYLPALRNPGNLMEVRVQRDGKASARRACGSSSHPCDAERVTATEALALDVGWRYTVFVGAERILRVTRDERVPR